MLPNQLEGLGEVLLRGGVAPRYVRRFLREVREHFEDLFREESAKGLNQADAARNAWAKLGDAEVLTKSVLCQPALRSHFARYPRLAFTVAPVIVWLAIWLAVFLALIYSWEIIDTLYTQFYNREIDRSGFFTIVWLICLFFMRVLPVAMAVTLLIAAFRRRISLRWPIIGAALLAFLGGTCDLDIELVKLTSPWLYYVYPFSGLCSPGPYWSPCSQMNAAEIAAAIFRSIAMFVAALTIFAIWRRSQRSAIVGE